MLLAALVVLAGLAAPLARALGPGVRAVDARVVLPSGREYVLHTPPALRRTPALAEGRPAMVFLHGLNSDPADADRSTRFSRLADRDGLLLAYPTGVHWSFNAGLCCGDAAADEVDDVGFLAQVVADLRGRGASRIAVVGFSNGGMMAYRFACERPDLVDSVGVMSGTLEIPHCDGPIRALAINGARDGTVPIKGAVYDRRLKCFLRDVGTIAAAAPGSSVTQRILPAYGHRWTGRGDPVDATEAFWQFARLGR